MVDIIPFDLKARAAFAVAASESGSDKTCVLGVDHVLATSVT